MVPGYLVDETRHAGRVRPALHVLEEAVVVRDLLANPRKFLGGDLACLVPGELFPPLFPAAEFLDGKENFVHFQRAGHSLLSLRTSGPATKTLCRTKSQAAGAAGRPFSA